ncbi:NAD(P)-binding domain-containing protein [Desertibacillus haloalkaliphilus]|uniref:NAD(P)-binding domain-containing protein n=1 Tax=Desertibacillus haloalkaliphilus TaxID=1328930 RepID=UPI001C26567B|nr:NAD(P)-binding domain-containing protein [Desertibacillus haloalkaliphilus]MBU8905265.1 NAD(P)-binding domain-containing protein [Desertibacillus haloalkaliphilus]
MKLFIGFGELAKALISLTSSNEKIYVFSRSTEKIVEAQKQDQRIVQVTEDQLHQVSHAFITLPSTAYEPFFTSYGHLFTDDTVFYHCATALMVEDIEAFISHGSVVPFKCVGQAAQIRRDQKVVFVTPKKHLSEVSHLKDWFGEKVSIVAGSEQQVLAANKEATRAAVEMAVDLKEKLRQQGLPDEIIQQSLEVTTRGVIQAFSDGKLGGFGKTVIKEIEDQRK